MMRHGRLLLAACAALVLADVVRAADAKSSPELEALKSLEGTWDAVVKVGDMESKGTMVYKMGVDGKWLLSDFEADFGGMKFKGHGIDGYDPIKKEVIGIWVDSMGPQPLIFHGTHDKDTHTTTLHAKSVGMDGQPVNLKSVTTAKDKDTMVFTLTTSDKDGKELNTMTIEYKRKK
jgi:hypothetical protein